MSSQYLRAIWILGIFVVLPAHGFGGDAAFEETGGQLLLQSPGWALGLDSRTGAIRRIDDRAVGGTPLRGTANLWVIERRKLPQVEASAGKMTYRWDAERSKLTPVFDRPEAAVTLVCNATEVGPVQKR